jgi:hypothetical protein
MAYKLIAVDLDGTLLNSERKVSAVNRAALGRAAAAGIRIMISSGRVLPEAERCVVGVDSVSLVSGCNGAIIRDLSSGEVIYSRALDFASCSSIIGELKAAKVFFSVYGEDTVYFEKTTLKRFPVLAPFVEGMACPRVTADDLVAELEKRGAPTYKIFAMSLGAGEIGPLRARFSTRGDMELSSSYANNIELTAKGVDKGNALRVVGSRFGILSEEMIAVGDGENDLSMLAAAGLPIAMGNASPEVQRAAKIVTSSNTEDGVAVAIDRYALAPR